MAFSFSHMLSRRGALSSLGFACFWAWLLLSLNTPVLFGFEGKHSISLFSISLGFYAVVVFLRVIGVCAAQKLDSVLTHTPALAVSTFALAVGTVIIFLSSLSNSNEQANIVVIVGVLLMAFGYVWLSSTWAQCLIELESAQLLFWVTMGFLLSACICLLAFVLPSLPLQVLLVALPLLSGLCIALSQSAQKKGYARFETQHRTSPIAPINKKPLPTKTLSLIIGILFIGLTGTIVKTVRSQVSIEELYLYGLFNTVGIALFAVVLLLAAVLLLPRLRREVQSLVFGRILFPLLAVALSLPGIFPSVPLSVANILISGGMCCFEILLVFYAVSYSRQFGTSVLKTYGITNGSMEAMAAIGPSLSIAIALFVGGEAGNWPTFALVMVVALMLITIFFLMPVLEFFNRVLFSEPANKLTKPLDFLVEQYNLTPRELEVATLLYRGRSLPFIQKELTISLSTTQTHTRHIYEKLGIHGRQELLSLIEVAIRGE